MKENQKYIMINEKSGEFYNFITQRWSKHLTLACLTNINNILTVSRNFENITIKQYFYNLENIKQDIVDVVLI